MGSLAPLPPYTVHSVAWHGTETCMNEVATQGWLRHGAARTRSDASGKRCSTWLCGSSTRAFSRAHAHTYTLASDGVEWNVEWDVEWDEERDVM